MYSVPFIHFLFFITFAFKIFFLFSVSCCLLHHNIYNIIIINMLCIRCTCCKGKGYFMRRYCDEVIKVACSSCNSSGEIWKK